MEELKNIAPNLHKQPKQDAFSTPHNYFDELPGVIQERIISKEKKSIFQWILPTLKFATPVAGVIVIALMYFNKPTSDVEQATQKEMTAYFDQQVDMEFDETLLAEELNTDNTESLDEVSLVEEYLLSDEIDENLLREEI